MNSLLAIFGFVGSLTLFICTLLFTIFCFFKARQSDGRGFVNDVLTDLGGGSFKEHVINPFRKIFWNILGIMFIFLTIFAGSLLLISSGYKGGATDQNRTNNSSVSDVKMQAVIPTPAQVPVSSDNSLGADKAPDTFPPKVAGGVAANEGAQQGVSTQSVDIFSVCESESNFISKNNCKWRICAIDDNKRKDECSKYINEDLKN